jgi:hypothetical protein
MRVQGPCGFRENFMINKPLLTLLTALTATLCSAQTGTVLSQAGKVAPALTAKQIASSALTSSSATLLQSSSTQSAAEIVSSSPSARAFTATGQPISKIGPHLPVSTPEPASLCALAFGLIPFFRRKKSA